MGSAPELSSTEVNGKKGGQRNPETEEEKQRNFLKRSRQGTCTEVLPHSSSLLMHFDYSGAEGLVGPFASKECVPDSGERESSRGAREHTRGLLDLLQGLHYFLLASQPMHRQMRTQSA